MSAMRTVSSSSHVLRLTAQMLEARGLPALTDEQAQAVTDAVDRWYGIPLDAPSADDIAAYSARQERPQ